MIDADGADRDRAMTLRDMHKLPAAHSHELVQQLLSRG